MISINGKIDAYLSAEAVGMEAIKQGEDLRPLTGDAFTMYLTGFLDKSSSLARRRSRAKVDQIVAKAQRSGALKALSLKYFGKDYATTRPTTTSPSCIRRSRRRPVG